MFDQQAIIDQIRWNCDVSDSRYAGNYSVCGLFLRLRDLYKWEHDLSPWIEEPPGKVIDWIDAKEQLWETLNDQRFRDICIDGKVFDPFDTNGINSCLSVEGLFYGAGYARSMKPTFFLSQVEERTARIGYDVFMLGKEWVRDLFATPALLQGDTIVIRRESAMRHLWDNIFYAKQSNRDPIRFALAAYGLDLKDLESIRPHLKQIALDDCDRYLYHELGELTDTVLDRTVWRGLIAAFPHTPIELLIRAVKDLLADTGDPGPLREFVLRKDSVLLAFYVAFTDGLIRALFPEIFSSFPAFMQTQDWILVEDAIASGNRTATKLAESISGIYFEGEAGKGDGWVKDQISEQILKPLGI